MKEFKQKFTIHPAGQGFFYSGVISFELDSGTKKIFRFVFDCGSNSQQRFCRDEIDNFKEIDFPEDEPLDLLIISHFDADHVNQLRYLLEGRTVKRIIMPFLNFSERLFLTLGYLRNTPITPNDSDGRFALSVMIDPINTLREFLSANGDFLLFQSGQSPFEPQSDAEVSSPEINAESLFDFSFGINPAEINIEDIQIFRISDPSIVRTLLDVSKGQLKIENVPIMEFLFYRKTIGPNESFFYDNVFHGFKEMFHRLFRNPDFPSTEEINNILIKYLTAARVRTLFRDAYNITPGLTIALRDISNLNTTSINLLCVNNHKSYRFLYDWIDHGRFFVKIRKLQKFDGREIITLPIHREYQPYIYDWYFYDDDPWDNLNHVIFPNSLLTADSFLLNDQDVDAFYTKYQNYWRRYWLFQIPHHGSKYNIDDNLLSRIPHYVSCFINYGTKNRHKHPDREVIQAITITNHANNLIPVNEFAGLQFEFQIS